MTAMTYVRYLQEMQKLRENEIKLLMLNIDEIIYQKFTSWRMMDISVRHHHLASRYCLIHSNASSHLTLRSCNAIWATVLKHLAIQTANIYNNNIIVIQTFKISIIERRY